MRSYDEDESYTSPVIRTVPDLMHAISTAETQEQRLAIYMRAAYLGWEHRLPRNWNPNGTLMKEAEL